MAKNKRCDNCDSKVLADLESCHKCGSDEFRPEFIEKKSKISRNFSVNVGSSFKDPNKKVLTLYKWFPRKGSWHVNINNLGEWEAISKIINEELGPFIGWKTIQGLNKTLIETFKKTPRNTTSLTAINHQYPKIIKEIIKVLDFKKINEKNHKHVLEILSSIAEIIEKSDEAFQISFKNVLKNLPKQERVALDQLDELLKDWTLKQVTGVTQVVKERLNEIIRLETAIDKDETYEIKGDNSIHRILERAMWIVDERYWLLHSNETLRKIVGDEIVKQNKKDEKIRPDFVCGSIDNKLVIVELKRPSHKLTTNDLGQLEKYLKIIESHSQDHKNFEAYLFGKRIDDDLIKTMKYRRTDIFKIRTFADLVDDTKRRYKEYLEKVL